VNCPNCDYPDTALLTNKLYSLCGNCGVYFHVDAGNDAKIKAYYSSGDYRARHHQPDEAAHQARRAKNIICYIDTAPLDFVDIGCSAGILMQTVRDTFGSNVYGVDIDTVLAHGVYQDISDVPVAPDCVAMIHSLEHMSHPLAELKRVHDKMAQGGQIVIEVPNGDVESGKFYFGSFSFPHVVMFSPAALRWTMERAGFTVTFCVLHGDGGIEGAKEYYYLLMTGIK
jgi:hypothetical protein